MADLNRFIEAQDRPGEGFASALAEIRRGGKRGHWIWYVLPQLAGLGSSWSSRLYGIDGISEARSYLRSPILRSRLAEITTAIAEQLRRGTPVRVLMGSGIDTLKLVSSLTLFRQISRDLADTDGQAEYRELAENSEASFFSCMSLVD